MTKKIFFGFLLLILIVVASKVYFYRSTYAYSLQKRVEIAAQKNKEIHVAAVWNIEQDTSFIEGVKLAVEEVNQKGITLKSAGKKIKSKLLIHFFDDSTEQSSQQSRLEIAADQKIVAVLGHSSSSSAIPASISYEYNGILFISVVATDSALTQHGFKYTFSIIPPEKFFVNRLIQFAQKKKWHKLAILHARNSYGLGFFERFASQLQHPLTIVEVKSFFIHEEVYKGMIWEVFKSFLSPDSFLNQEEDYKGLIYELMKEDFDAIILAAVDENAAKMINQLREMSVMQPILGGDGLDNLKIWDWSEQTANQTYVATVFVGHAGFRDKFKKTYSKDPGYQAFQGYEAVHILADAIEKAGSSQPLQVASTLKYNFKQGYGGYVFATNGLVNNQDIDIKQFIDGKFVIPEEE